MGQVLNGRYELETKVGDGGMAVVYQGRDRVLGRTVAIKVLREQYASDAAFLSRFRREAQSAAALSHPNIVNIYDVGEDAALHYIVMEYVPGHNLKDLIRADGPLSARQAVDLGRQFCAALGYAHQRGLVHRDIKPQNILVTPEGLVKVADFGIAKGLHDANLTATGVAMGTVHYAAPEQVEGKEAIPASDIYAAGVVLYEMLTGRLPFDGETPVSIALKHLNDVPTRPRAFNPQVPTGLETVVLTALSKEPADRFPTAEALSQALADYQFYSTPRSAALRTAAARTAAVPVQRLAGNGRATAVRPALDARAATTQRAPAAGAAGRPRRAAPATAPRDDIGCLTWVAGALGLVLLLGLVLGAFAVLPRLAGTTILPSASPSAAAPTAPPPTRPAGGQPTAPAGPAVVPTRLVVPTSTPTPAATATPTAPPTATPTVTPTVTPTATATPVPKLPDLRGRTLDEAQRLLEPLKVTLVEVNKPGVFHDQVPAGRIVEQAPPPDTLVQPGSTVRVTLSRGRAVQVPELRNQERALATRVLTDLGLEVKVIEEASREVAAGRVIRSDPVAGASVGVGGTVTLVISQGDLVAVPDIFNRSLPEARRMLEEAGLRLGSVNEQSRNQLPEAQRPVFDRVRPGNVLSATPTYGTLVPRGSEVAVAIRKRD